MSIDIVIPDGSNLRLIFDIREFALLHTASCVAEVLSIPCWMGLLVGVVDRP